MDVFLCWSGDASLRAARKLFQWLPMVIGSVRPWYSEEIELGARWNAQIADRLAASSFGIICLTPAAARSPWVMFEAGALAATNRADGRGRILPMLLGIDDDAELPSPLAAFQSTGPTRDGIWRLVRALDGALPVHQRMVDLEIVYDAFWDDLDDELAEIVADAGTEVSPDDGSAALEELLRRTRHTNRHLNQLLDAAAMAMTEVADVRPADPSTPADHASRLLAGVVDQADGEGFDDPWDGRLLDPPEPMMARRAADIVHVLAPLGLKPAIHVERPGNGYGPGADLGVEVADESDRHGTIDVRIDRDQPVDEAAGADLLRRIVELGFDERLILRHVDESGESHVHERPPTT